MSAPRWAAGLLRRVARATDAEADVLVGDLEEAHRSRVAARGAFVASLLTVVLPQPADWTVPATLFIGYGLGTYLLAVAGLAAAGVAPLRLLGRSLRGALFLSHWLLVVPAALLRIALWPATTDFARTARRSMVDR